MESLLDECADLHILCEGQTIKANKFTMLSRCTVLKDLHEETGLQGANAVPLPGIPASWPRIAVDLLHGIKKPETLCCQDVWDAQDAFEFLGCATMKHALVTRLWFFAELTRTQSELLHFVPRIMSTKTHRSRMLSRFRILGPRWVEMRELIRALDLCMELAIFCMQSLSRIYPAGIVYKEIVENLPASLATSANLMILMSAHPRTSFFHPGEMQLALQAVFACTNPLADSGHERDFISTILMTTKECDTVPARRIVASTTGYEGMHRVSAFVDASAKRGADWNLRAASWLRIRKAGGALHGELDLWRIASAGLAVSCNVHILAVADDGTANSYKAFDVWRRYEVLDDYVVDFAQYDPGTDAEKEFSELVASPHFKYLHINAFYGIFDVMRSPSF
jgi:hypothetical protein